MQVLENAGPGAWANGVSGFACFIVFFIALKKGEKNIVFLDCISMVVAIISLMFWYVTENPVITIILITIIEICGFFPTVRKSYHKPHEETAVIYFTSGLAYFCTLFAMKTYTITTLLYPSALVFMNGLFVFMLLWRRKVTLRKSETKNYI